MLVTEPLELLPVPVSPSALRRAAHTLHHRPQHPQESARVTEALQRCAEGTGTRMQAEPWKGTTHLLCPSPPRLGVAAVDDFQHTPSLVPVQPFWPASRGTEPSLHLCRLARSRGERGLAAGFPAPGIPHAGLAAVARRLGNPSCHLPPRR